MLTKWWKRFTTSFIKQLRNSYQNQNIIEKIKWSKRTDFNRCRQSHFDYIRRIVSTPNFHRNNHIKAIKNARSPYFLPETMTFGNEIATSEHEKVDLFAKFFNSVYRKPNSNFLDLVYWITFSVGSHHICQIEHSMFALVTQRPSISMLHQVLAKERF